MKKIFNQDFLGQVGIAHPALIIVSIAISLLLFIIFSNIGQFGENPLFKELYPKSSSQAADSPKYNLGLGYVMANRSFGREWGWNKVGEVSQIAFIQGHWQDWLDSQLFQEDVQAARAKGLKIYVSLDILGYSGTPRQNVEVPASLGLSGDFTNSAVRQAYLELVKNITQQIKPDYFVVLVEANLHKLNNQTSFASFKGFYPQVYYEIKNISPGTKVGVSSVYGDLVSPSGFEMSDKQRFAEDVADFDNASDILPVSIYPFFVYLKVSNIPENLLEEIANYSQKPLFISETSWVSSSFSIPNIDPTLFSYTPQDQVDYMKHLEKSAQLALEKGKKIEAINFISLIDITQEDCSKLKAQTSILEWFCYLGLVDGQGVEKLAFSTMKQWKFSLSQIPTPSPFLLPSGLGTPSPTPFVAPSPSSIVSLVPTAPSNLKGSVAGKKNIKLNWLDRSNNETRIEVGYKNSATSIWKTLSLGANTTGYTFTNLAQSNSYSFYIKACNNVGCSPSSNQVTISLP